MKTFLFLLTTLNIFAQMPGNGVTDIDGNFYNSVIIGDQEWMVENLHVSHFNNGDNIPTLTTDGQGLSKWCYYQNDESYGLTFGKVYEGPAIVDPRLIAPEGWHIPNNQEWQTLIDNLGGNAVAGGKMKSLELWNSPNTGATNESGFSALPALGRNYTPDFQSTTLLGKLTTFWSSQLQPLATYPIDIYFLEYNSAAITHYTIPPSAFFSVRCLKGASLNSNELNKPSIKIYPNPTNDEIHLKLGLGTFTVIVNNLLGQEIVKINVDNDYAIKMERFGKGIYIVRIFDSSDTMITSQKIIVK